MTNYAQFTENCELGFPIPPPFFFVSFIIKKYIYFNDDGYYHCYKLFYKTYL